MEKCNKVDNRRLIKRTSVRGFIIAGLGLPPKQKPHLSCNYLSIAKPLHYFTSFLQTIPITIPTYESTLIGVTYVLRFVAEPGVNFEIPVTIGQFEVQFFFSYYSMDGGRNRLTALGF